jgi:dephospho-CoA kinase
VYLVGLTGGIGAGKSTVAQRLVHHGAELIDADAIAREQMLPGTQTWKKVVEHFGKSILDDDGFVDRPALGRIVFTDPDKRTLLNELTHPPVIEEIANRLELLAAFDGLVILDVPLLVEAGVTRGYDAVLVVAAHPPVQIERLVRQRAMTEDEAAARVAAQSSLEEKLAVATHVVWNDGTMDVLLSRVDELAEELNAAARAKAEQEARELPDH